MMVLLFAGYYYYLEATDKLPGHIHAIRNTLPYLGNKQFYRMSFWYHMYGEHIGDLYVNVVSHGKEQLLLNITGGNFTGKYHCYHFCVLR